jgi:hypothetical protein
LTGKNVFLYNWEQPDLPDNESSEQGALVLVAPHKDGGGEVQGQTARGGQARDVLFIKDFINDTVKRI